MERQQITKVNQGDTQREAPLFAKPALSPPAPVLPFLQLQQTIGNQAVGCFIQAKLKVNQPGEVYEQEADRVADEAMRMLEPAPHEVSHSSSPAIQRKCAACADSGEPCPQCAEEEKMMQRKPLAAEITPLIQRQATAEPEEEEETLQAKEVAGATPTVTPAVESHINNMRSGGQPWPAFVRASFEPRFGRDLNRIPTYPPAVGAIQTKLRINKPGDEYEQEADRVADQVLAAPIHSTVSGTPTRIQRYTGKPTGQADAAPASVDRVLASSGRPLEPALQQDMGQRFGHDFSRVRVHSGATAEQSAREVNAHAYTVGHNIVFGAGRFAPGIHEGRRLIAHELAHVVQQSGTASAPQRLDISALGEPAEVAAETAATQLLHGTAVRSLGPQPVRIYRSNTSGALPTPAAPVPGRTIQIDTNVIVEIGKGNVQVAQTLRTRCQTPGVKVQIDRFNYTEATTVGPKVSAAEAIARKLMIEKLPIEIIDMPIAQRASVYQEFAEDPKGGFTKHGAPSVSNKALKTYTDLSHIATAKASNAEIWSFDSKDVWPTAKKLDIAIAPESSLPTVQGVPSNEQNIMRLVPEVTPADLASAMKPAPSALPPQPSQPGLGPSSGPGTPEPGPSSPKLASDPVPAAGSAPKIATPKTPVTEGAVPEVAEVTVAGAALRGIGKLAIGIAIQVFLQWVLSWLFELQVKIDIINILGPQLAKKLEQLKPKIASLKSNKKLFIRIGYEFKYTRSTDLILGAPPLYVFGSFRLSYVHLGHEELDFEPTSDEYSEKALPLTDLVTHKFGYAVLLDDPEKRALEKERGDLTDRLNRIAKQQQSKSPSPQPSATPQPQVAPLLSPPSVPAPAMSSPILQKPGAQFGPSKAEQADQALKTLEQIGEKLVERGVALQRQKNSDNRPATDDFIKDENQWRTMVEYFRNWSAREGLDSRVKEFKDLLGDPSRPGQKLEKLRQDLAR